MTTWIIQTFLACELEDLSKKQPRVAQIPGCINCLNTVSSEHISLSETTTMHLMGPIPPSATAYCPSPLAPTPTHPLFLLTVKAEAVKTNSRIPITKVEVYVQRTNKKVLVGSSQRAQYRKTENYRRSYFAGLWGVSLLGRLSRFSRCVVKSGWHISVWPEVLHTFLLDSFALPLTPVSFAFLHSVWNPLDDANSRIRPLFYGTLSRSHSVIPTPHLPSYLL